MHTPECKDIHDSGSVPDFASKSLEVVVQVWLLLRNIVLRSKTYAVVTFAGQEEFGSCFPKRQAG